MEYGQRIESQKWRPNQHNLPILSHATRISPPHDGAMFILQGDMDWTLLLDWNRLTATANKQLSIMIHEWNQDVAQRQERVLKIIYTAWNIWKERCRRVFDKKAVGESQLQDIIRTDVQQWRMSRSCLSDFS
jgi:hypothetical protein